MYNSFIHKEFFNFFGDAAGTTVGLMRKRNKVDVIFRIGALLGALLLVHPHSYAADLSDAETRARAVGVTYEKMVRRALEQYYDPLTYLVHAKIVLEEMVIPLEYSKAHPFFAKGITRLPGLPTLPDELRPGIADGSTPADSLRVTRFRKDYGIKFVDISVVVDTMYTLHDFEFIMELVQMTANLDEYRGDRLNIRKTVFPRKSQDGPEHKVAQIHDDFRRDTLFIVQRDSVNQAELAQMTNQHLPIASNQTSLWEPWLKDLPSLLPLILIFCFVIIIILIIVRSLKPATPAVMKEEKNAPMDSILSEIQSLKESSANRGADADDVEAKMKYRELRNFAINAFIGDSSNSGRVLTKWIDSNRENGVRSLAILALATDPKILELQSRYIGTALLQAVDLQLRTLEEPELGEKSGVLKLFKQDFEQLQTGLPNGEAMTEIFGFMRQLTTSQLQQILRGENDGIVALSLAQLPADKSSAYLAGMDSAMRAKILVGMGQLDRIPVRVYKDVAERLSLKALEVSNMKYVAADGVESILAIIDALPLTRQQEYVQSIATVDLELGEKVRNLFVAFEELPQLEEALLAKVLPEMDRDVLAMAMVGMSEASANKFMSYFPERARLMIQSSMETGANATSEEIEQARRKLLGEFRRELRARGGRG
jgi:hypothetical protein